MAARPGGLCAPRVRSEGNRNSAEPCTRSPVPGGWARAASPGWTAQHPASRPATPPAWLPEPGSSVTRALRGEGFRSGSSWLGPFSNPQALHQPGGSQRAGPSSPRPPAFASQSPGCRPRPAHCLLVVSARAPDPRARPTRLRRAALQARSRLAPGLCPSVLRPGPGVSRKFSRGFGPGTCATGPVLLFLHVGN